MAAQNPLDLAQQKDAVWTLNEFVDIANALLPVYLPKDASGRTTDDVNTRLVRHYATQGLLSEARKEGREARYLYDHLLQLLAVRRLLADGFSTAATKQVMEGRSNDELERLLEGRVRVELVPEATQSGIVERTEFLKKVRARAGLDTSRHEHQARVPAATPARSDVASVFSESHWTRLSVLDGLDLFVRDDFTLPKHRLGDAQLTQLLQVVLLQLEQRRKGTT